MTRHLEEVRPEELRHVTWPKPSNGSAKPIAFLVAANGNDQFELLRRLHEELKHLVERAAERCIAEGCGLEDVVVIAPPLATPTVMNGYQTGAWRPATSWLSFRAWFAEWYGADIEPDVSLCETHLVLAFSPSKLSHLKPP